MQSPARTGRHSGNLEQIRVASPCTANWDEMIGNDQQRFCQLCKLNVYNLSNMTRQQAEDFVRHAEGHVCVRLHKRTDGTVISKDCPVGFRAAARKFAGKLAAGFMLSMSLVLGGFSIGCTKPASGANPAAGTKPASTTGTTGTTGTSSPATPTPTPQPPTTGGDEEVIMGDMCAPEDMPGQNAPNTLALTRDGLNEVGGGKEVLMGKICAPDNEAAAPPPPDGPKETATETPQAGQ